MAEIFDNVRQIRGMHVFEQLVGNVQADAALGICFENIAELPANGVSRYSLLQSADNRRRDDPAEYATQHRSNTDVDLEDVQNQLTVFILSEERDVIDTNYLASLCINDLLIEQVTDHTQHVFVRMIGRQALVLKVNAICINVLHLVIANAEPSRSSPDEIPVYTNRIDQ